MARYGKKIYDDDMDDFKVQRTERRPRWLKASVAYNHDKKSHRTGRQRSR